MTDWLRKDSIRLGEIAYQIGLTPHNAADAVILGARFLAHGFSTGEVNEMIMNQYSTWAEEDKAVRLKTATPSQARRWWERQKR